MEAIPLDGFILIHSTNTAAYLNVVHWLKSRAASYRVITPSIYLSDVQDISNLCPHHVILEEGKDFEEVLEAHVKPKQLTYVEVVELIPLEIGNDETLRIIDKLKGNGCICTVLLEPLEDLMPLNRTTAIADALIQLTIEDGKVIAKTTRWDRSGRKHCSEEELVITEGTERMVIKKYERTVEIAEPSAKQPKLASSFDMGLELKDSEKKAKEALKLPYTKMQQEENLVKVHISKAKVRVGGQVIYTPDEGDDLDDSDPDDDLNL